MDLSAIQELAGSQSPMGAGSVPILQARTLYLDADGLAYYCAGNDETPIGQARSRLKEKIDSMTAACGAGKTVLLLTGSGSHKGHRYAIARVKPYQGNRTNSRRPKNWALLRELLESGAFGENRVYLDREADDAFGQYGWADPENTAIGADDKDMRMVPGYHVGWRDNRVCFLAPGTYDMQFGDKQYGMKWFWLQMLHGDTADNIPGLPRTGIAEAVRINDGGIDIVPFAGTKLALCGEVTAGKLLACARTNDEAAATVATCYRSYYKERWLTELLEQAALLWMRRGPAAHWQDMLLSGGPLARFNSDAYPIQGAVLEIEQRIKEADDVNSFKGE